MGDRAVVIFRSGFDFSPCVYVHWAGSEIPRLLIEAAPKMRKGDLSYACARFIGHLHENIPGPLSLGVYNSDPIHDSVTLGSPGDAGVFLVDIDTGKVENVDGYPTNPDGSTITLNFAEV